MITPIIMEADMGAVSAKMGLLRDKGEQRVHFDIGDGLFCDLLTIAPADLQTINLSGLGIDFHLLVDDPVEWIEECVALSPKRIFGQIEHMGSQKIFVDTIEGYKVEAGLALKLETPIEAIEEEVLKYVKSILLLEIPPGTTGSTFDMRVIEKIKKLRERFAGSIVVDGGINPETYQLAIGAGASEAGANSAYWKGVFDEKN